MDASEMRPYSEASVHGAALSPEVRLLFLAGRVSPADSALRHLLRGEIDWDGLATLAELENAAAILVKRLTSAGADSSSPGYKKLRQLARKSTMQMLQLEPVLLPTIAFLRERQIEPVLLKGAGLVYTAYASASDRPMSDLDVLVPEASAQTAWALLQTQGWTASETTAESTRFSGHHHLPRLVSPDSALPLEIHGGLLSRESPFLFSIDAFWARTETLIVKGQVVRVPHAIHQLWHACVHFAWSHTMKWGSWRTFRDVTRIIDQGGVDWTEFQTLARTSRAATCCYWTLRLARRLMGAAVPDATLEMLRPPYPGFIVNRLERHLLVSLVPASDRCPSVRLSRRLWEVAIAPRWSGHGKSRPWHMSDRWVSGSEAHASQQQGRGGINDRLRRVIAGGAYLLRVSRLSLPVDSA